MLTTAPGITERFLAKVAKADCWEWTAYRDRDGYGKFFTHKVNGYAVKEYAHRWAYSRWVGPIPDGMEVDHLCRNRGCVRPDHLQAVTKQENNRRSNSLSAQRRRQTHCVRGHELSGSNLRINPDGRRDCKACDREYQAARRGPRRPHWQATKTHCPKGHEYAGDNLIMITPTKRGCRTCRHAASARWRARQ